MHKAKTQPTADSTQFGSDIARAVKTTLETYLEDFGDAKGIDPSNLHRLILDQVERPMIEVMLRYTHGNQSRAADCMGINRATLRAKQYRHGLM